MKTFYITSILLLCHLIGSAQTEIDALRFSRIYPYGSARSTAMGGAFGALGGDISSLSVNPGGIGVFRKSEISFTSMLDFNKVESGIFERSKNRYLIGSLGFVASFTTGNKKWKSINFGFNYINLNNFNRDGVLGGHISENSSLIDVWKMEADGHKRADLDPFTTSLAYDAYLLKKNPNNETMYDIPLVDGDKLEQKEYIRNRGYQGEYALSIGTNYNDKLYLGATLGIQSIHYRSHSIYAEGFPKGTETTSKLNYFNFHQIFNTEGVGVNFKTGVIYRPTPLLRLGFAIHTPTIYRLDAHALNNVSAFYFEAPDETAKGTEFGNEAYTDYSYKLRTPWRFIASAATVLGQRAIISFDYEYVDYTNAKFYNVGDGNDYDGYMLDKDTYVLGTNDMIKETYRSTHNFRVGGEYRFSSIFSLRGGYSYWASPYKTTDLNGKNDLQTVSGGFGLNFSYFYIDASYMHKLDKENKYFYNYQNSSMPQPLTSPEVQSNLKNNEFRITLGIRI